MAAFLSGIADVDLMSMSNLHATLDIQGAISSGAATPVQKSIQRPFFSQSP